jgi:hypothetical protein
MVAGLWSGQPHQRGTRDICAQTSAETEEDPTAQPYLQSFARNENVSPRDWLGRRKRVMERGGFELSVPQRVLRRSERGWNLGALEGLLMLRVDRAYENRLLNPITADEIEWVSDQGADASSENLRTIFLASSTNLMICLC